MADNNDMRTICEALPTDLAAFLSWVVPTQVVPAEVTNIETAILANGKASYNECVLMHSLEGLPLIRLLLRIGQHSNINIISALLGATSQPSGTTYTGISNYEQSFDPFQQQTGARFTNPSQSISALEIGLAELMGLMNAELPEDYLSQLALWGEEMSIWVTDCEALIVEAEAQHDSQESYDMPSIPPVPLPPPPPVQPDPTLPAPVYWFLWLVYWINRLGLAPIVKNIVREVLRRIVTGGNSSALIMAFKHFGFLWEGKNSNTPPPQNPSEMTTIHLLNADKPIEIINSLNEKDVFLDTHVIDE